jgi:TRAP-type C4-dicarboxylate transport system permease small subunit
VALILLVHGWTLAEIRSTGTVQSLDISRFWMFLPIPVSGALMLLFIAEWVMDLVRGRE